MASEETRTSLNPSLEAGLALQVIKCVIPDSECMEGQ